MVVEKVDLGYVVIAYNSERDLRRLLPSLPTSKNIVVVDNFSSDKSVEVAKNFGAYVIETNENTGYDAAVNKGIEFLRDKCTHFFVLNPDTKIKTFKINEKILREYGIIQPLILLPDGKVNVEKLCMNVFGFVYPENYDLSPRELKQQEMPFFSGAGFIISKKAFDEVGLFDESLFLYYDDIDYAIRCWQKNKKILFYPEIIIEHFYKNSFGNKKKTKFLMRNRITIMNRYLPDRWRKAIFVKKCTHDQYTFSAEDKEKFARYIKPDLLFGFNTKQIPVVVRAVVNLFMKPYSWIIKRFFI